MSYIPRFRLNPLILAIVAVLPAPTFALPTAPTVAHGSASFNTSGNTLTVTNTPNAIINWGSFSIGQNELTKFIQQSSASAVLNRVIGQDPSKILGQLQSNGRVFLINPNGILFGAGSRIDTAGLIASTLNLSDSDFLAGKLKFTNTGTAGKVENQGTITTPNGGQIFLIAPNVENSGIIHAPNGDILLAAGQSVEITDSLNPALRVQITSPEGQVTNLGQILAESGRIGLHGGMVANAGTINASSAVAEGGKIYLRATNRIDLTDTSKLGADGTAGGEITAIVQKDGKIAGELVARGEISAQGNGTAGSGGFVETSAAKVNVNGLRVKTRGGKWLIDPNDFTIAASGGNMTGIDVASALVAGNFEIQTATMGTPGGNGDIFVNDIVNWTSGFSLTLNAQRDININSDISWTAGNLYLVAGSRDININAVLTATGTSTLAMDAFSGQVNAGFNPDGTFKGRIDFGGRTDSFLLYINDSPYTLVNTVSDLQAMAMVLNGRYALGQDITSGWSGGEGFEPIGNGTLQFSGVFDGLGHMISGLTINRPLVDNQGLFYSINGGTVRNVGLTNVSIAGNNRVGALAASNQGTILNSFVSGGSVSGTTSLIGSLVGFNDGTIGGSYATGNVIGGDSSEYLGGLVGVNSMGGAISGSYAAGNVTGGVNSHYLGGLAGANTAGTISTSYAAGNVSSGNGSWYIGGFVGANEGGGPGPIYISNSYATGNVGVGSSSHHIGSFVGNSTIRIDNTYASGSVTAGVGSTHVGHWAGYDEGGGNNNYFNKDTVPCPVPANCFGTGLTSAQMRQQASFTGWDFTSIWNIDADSSYAYLHNPEQTPHPGVVFSGFIWDGGGVNMLWSTEANWAGDSLPTMSSSVLIGSGYDTILFDIASLSLASLSSSSAFEIQGGKALTLSTAGTFTDVLSLGANSTLTAQGTLALNSNPTLATGAKINITTSGTGILTIAGLSYTVINSLGAAGSTTMLDLQGMRGNLTRNYAIGSDINASATSGWGSGTDIGFAPIGDGTNAFTGNFDGLGHTISNLTINRPATSHVGLFGNSTGQLVNVGLLGGSVTGAEHVGMLAGISGGTVSNAYSTGNVTGQGYDVGGLVGYNEYGSITLSHSSAIVSAGAGSRRTGGLAGANWGTITESYATGTVNGSNEVGGFVGGSGGTIGNSYATGAVQGTYDVGGLAGKVWSGSVSNSHYDIDNVSINGGRYVTQGGLYAGQYVDWIADKSIDITNYSATLPLSGGYYQVSSVQGMKDLLGFADNAAYKFKLAANIDLSSASGYFIPILRAPEFDGNGYAISNLAVNQPFNSKLGLFGFADNASILNVSLVNANVTGHDQVGGLVGLQQAAGGSRTIANVTVSGIVTGGGEVGGVIGRSHAGTEGVITITNVSSNAAVNGLNRVGGFVGVQHATGGGSNTISNSSSTGTVTGNFGGWDAGIGGFSGFQEAWGGTSTITSSYHSTGLVQNTGNGNVGGLVGMQGADNATATISRSYNTATVTTGGDYSGGLVGYQYSENGSGNAIITESYNAGAVTGTSNVGGLAGYLRTNAGGISTVSNTYSTGAVTGTDKVGGLVGETSSASTVANSYSAGLVTGTTNVGGLIGQNAGSVTSSYWNTMTSGQATSAGGTGLTTAQMKQQASFSGWNFAAIWNIEADVSYPYLRNQEQIPHPGIGTCATSFCWDGGGSDGLWNTATNWLTNIVPTVGSTVTIGGSAYTVSFNVASLSLAALTIENTSSLSIASGALTVTGTTTLGGTLAISGTGSATLSGPLSGGTSGQVNISGGSLAVNGTSSLQGLNLTGGTLMVNSGRLSVLGSLTQSGIIDIASGAFFQKTGGFTNAGTIRGNGTIEVGSGNTLLNDGTLSPGGDGALGTLSVTGNLTLNAAGTLKIDVGGTSANQADRVSVSGDVGINGTLNGGLFGSYTTPVLADAIPFLTMTGTASGTFLSLTGLSNFVTGYRLAPGEAARLIYAGTDPNTKIFTNLAGGMTWETGGNWSSGTLPTSVQTAVISSVYAVNHNTANADSIANLQIRSGSGLDISGGSIAVSGSATVGGTLNLLTGGTYFNDGTLDITSTGALNLSGGTLGGIGNLSNAGTMSLANQTITNAITNSGTLNSGGGLIFTQLFTNGGTFSANGGMTTFNNGFLQNAGSLILNGGNVAGNLTLNGGMLKGSGTINGNVSLSAATLAPGFSPGTLNITGNLTLTPSSITAIELWGATAGLYDVINVSGTVNLAGALNATTGNGYVPGVGDALRFMTFANSTGSFGSMSIPSGLTFSALANALDLLGPAYSSTNLPATVASTVSLINNTVTLGALSYETPLLYASGQSSTTASSSGVLTQTAEMVLPAWIPDLQETNVESAPSTSAFASLLPIFNQLILDASQQEPNHECRLICR
jgi:filamentous hemagglutinin family protein